MSSSGTTANGNVSFWWTQQGFPPEREALPGSLEADVCIVGAGYTGLWTAYYLNRSMPSLDVVIQESRFAGFGASGRNGGWLTNSITGGRSQYLSARSRAAVESMQKIMNDAVDEVARVAARENFDIDFQKGGELNVAYNQAQLSRLRNAAESESRWISSGAQRLTAAETIDRVGVAGALGGLWHPHCARINPVKLVRGLAESVEKLGVKIYERTLVSEIRPQEAVSNLGTVRAPVIIRATEGFTSNIKKEHRTWLPMNSSLIVTEPLASQFWDSVGWQEGDALGDFAHVYMYAQRTADDRIALGGRGLPYRF